MIKKITKKIIFYIQFLIDYKKYKILSKDNSRFPITWQSRNPRLSDKTSQTSFDRHYIYHTAWAARILFKTKPEFHVDVSSSLYFSSIVSAFIPIKFYDIRPPTLKLDNLEIYEGDLINLPIETNSINSISCMHTVEHVGLGRYGNPIDPQGDIKAIEELKRVLAVGGNMLFVIPIGKSILQFNAHRIYSYNQILSYFKDLKLREFSLIPKNKDKGDLIRNATKAMADQETYGCGCFWFTK